MADIKFDIYHFYDEVFMRPGLFVEDISIAGMKQFLSGAKTALERMCARAADNVTQRAHGEYVGFEFDRWLSEKTGTPNFQSACDLIGRDSSSEDIALERLTELYKAFRGQKFNAYVRYVSNKNVKF
ncbi:MAG: hypothetical protein ABJN69_08120 [Hellea sp.]